MLMIPTYSRSINPDLQFVSYYSGNPALSRNAFLYQNSTSATTATLFMHTYLHYSTTFIVRICASNFHCAICNCINISVFGGWYIYSTMKRIPEGIKVYRHTQLIASANTCCGKLNKRSRNELCKVLLGSVCCCLR